MTFDDFSELPPTRSDMQSEEILVERPLKAIRIVATLGKAAKVWRDTRHHRSRQKKKDTCWETEAKDDEQLEHKW